MTITLNQTIIQDCDDQGTTLDWQNDTNNANAAAGIAAGETGQNGVPPKQGTGTVEFHSATAISTCGIRMINTVTSFSIRDNEVACWFLNPKVGESGAGNPELLANSDSALRLRVYSGANYADYDQTVWRLADGNWQGGWLYLRASGAAGSESRNSGTWTNTQADAVDRIGVTVETQATNNNKNALEYQVDYAKYYDKIVVTGYQNEPTNTIPWTLADIYAEDLADNGANPEEWGVVNNLENFFKFFCGIDFGNGTTTTEFEASNEFMFLDHSSSAFKQDVVITNAATVTLGVKNVQTEATYAQDGVQLVATENGQFQLTTPEKCSPLLTVNSGGILKIYAGLIQGFGTVSLGGGGSAVVEKLFSDFYDNGVIEFRTTGMTVDACRYHIESTDKGNLGVFYSAPTSLNRLTIFNCFDGMVFRISYNGANRVQVIRSLGGTQYDVGIIDPGTLDLSDSIIDPTRIKRVI